jgi:hypothetical protein
MPSRANFLKAMLAGIAAAPAAASVVTHEHVKAPAMPGKWKEKHWRSGGLHFSEYILPITMPSTFEEARKDRPMHRKIMIPMFDREVVDAPFKTLVDSMIATNARRVENIKRHGMPVVDEDGNSIDYGTDEVKTNYVTVVKVEGHPTLMGLGLTEFKLVPVRDYYRDVAERNKRVKAGMSTLVEDDEPQVQAFTEKEEVARREGRVGKTSLGGSKLRTL